MMPMDNKISTEQLKAIGNVYKSDKGGHFISVKKADLKKAAESLKNLGVYRISSISGYDSGTSIDVYYHFIYENMPVNIKISLQREKPEVETITGIFPGAKLFERELSEMLGVEISGNSDPKNVFLADISPKTPLRKNI